MSKITKDGLIRNQTELTMFRNLHQRPNDWKHVNHFMYRRTANALQGVDRWVKQGVLEVSQEPMYPGATYTWTMYRLAPQYRDASLISDDLSAREGALAEQEARNRHLLAHSRDRIAEAYATMQDAMYALAAYDDEHLEQLVDLTRELNSALLARRAALATQEQIAEDRAALDADLQASAHAEDDLYAVAGADPLGGDA